MVSNGDTPRPTPSIEAAAAHLIEHAHFLDQPQRMIERQKINQRAEAQAAGALRGGGEEQAGRCRGTERRRMMLGEVIAVEPGAVVGLDQA